MQTPSIQDPCCRAHRQSHIVQRLPWHAPKDRRGLRQKLRRLRAAFAAKIMVSLDSMSGDVLAEVEVSGAECVSELRQRALAAAGDRPERSCSLLLDGQVLDDSKPLALAGFCDTGAELRKKASVTIVRIPELWGAVSSAGGSVTVYCWGVGNVSDVGQPRCVLQLPVGVAHEDAVTAVAFSPNGVQFLTASNDSTAKFWDIGTAECLCVLVGHTGGLTGCAFSPEGECVVTTSKDRTARLWSHGSTRHELVGHEASVWSGAFSPDGATVLTASRDKVARLWNASTGECLRLFEGHGAALWCAAFSQDGRCIATASSDQTVRLWELESATHLKTFEGHTNTVTCVSFSPDDKVMLTSSRDGSVQLCDVESGASTSLKPTEEDEDDGSPHRASTQFWAATFSPDGSTVMATASAGHVYLWRQDCEGLWSAPEHLNAFCNSTALACDLYTR